MLLDIMLLVLAVAGFINGFKKGLIYSVFTFVSLFLGVMLAMKYSCQLTDYLYRQEIAQSKFIPFISFMIILVAVLVVMQIVYKMVQAAAETLFLGQINKIIGGILWMSILIFLFSIILWYLDKLHVMPEGVKTASRSYQYISALAPVIIEQFSKLVPWFQGIMDSMERLMESEQPLKAITQNAKAYSLML